MMDESIAFSALAITWLASEAGAVELMHEISDVATGKALPAKRRDLHSNCQERFVSAANAKMSSRVVWKVSC